MSVDQGTDHMKALFGMIFLLAQRWQNLGDKELSQSGLTTKQWLLLVCLNSFFSSPPTMNELSQAMGTSRQNVKQLALNLEKRGFVKIIPDIQDKRILRFQLTDSNQKFWAERVGRDEEFINSLFSGVSEEALQSSRKTIQQLFVTTEKLLAENDEEVA